MLWGSVKTSAVKSDNPDQDTHSLLMKYTVLYLNACFDGTHASEDPWGDPWPVRSDDEKLAGQQRCNGIRCVCWAIVGDLDCF